MESNLRSTITRNSTNPPLTPPRRGADQRSLQPQSSFVFICAAMHKSFRSLHKFGGTGFFFLSPRRRSGERTEERCILTQCPSSPRPSPPSDGAEALSSAPAVPRGVHAWFDLS